MGKTYPMQPWVTLKGSTNYLDALVQPASGWVNGDNFKEAVMDFNVIGNTVSTGTTLCDLLVQTAVAPEGPWTDIATISTGYCRTTKYFTSNEGGTDQFDRFLRWRLDPSGAVGDWTITFKICTTMK